MSPTDSRPDLATERLLAVIDNEEIARRYPNGAHFIAADHPEHGAMATRACSRVIPSRSSSRTGTRCS